MTTIDGIPNITANFSDDVYKPPDETPYQRIFLELFTLVALISLAANCFLVYVIFKYKKLRKETTNKIFLHLNILQAVFLIATPLTLRFAIEFVWSFEVHLCVFCTLYQIELNAQFAITGILFLLVCDSYLSIYSKDKYKKFGRFYKYFLISLYVLTGCTSLVTIQYCFTFHYMVLYAYFVMIVAIIILVVFLIVINIIHVIKKRKLTNYKSSNIGLVVPNIFFLLWSPFLIFLLQSVLGITVDTPITAIILCSLGFSSPVLNLIYVYFYDNNFNVFLRQVFTCRCKEYKNENLEDQSVAYNDIEGVQITQNEN
ncbi:type-1A angiotensin II receptor-like [Tribolium madens]|uniref:type-1A angiotensin II receptor-like n=1 Tax=Tribolium madens TaxID=41895 RepID=UPI001CF7216F|nr:type-1A angiotensin II receptor-like [Tribolium madens]XP_044268287.1 type-1A angiotensin II receptor-like [Tribolium madens]